MSSLTSASRFASEGTGDSHALGQPPAPEEAGLRVLARLIAREVRRGQRPASPTGACGIAPGEDLTRGSASGDPARDQPKSGRGSSPAEERNE